MNTLPNESTCPKCGQPVSLNAFEGLCPACLLQAGFGTLTGDIAAEKLSAFIPPTPEELARHFPQLEIIGLLGRGGMGAVYKARQIHLDRIVALKILPPAVSQAPAFADRFVREAKALAKLHHPNIVTLYESGQADDLFYFLMEFVDGVNLRQLLSTGTISAKDALAIVPQICDALQFAHDRGIVHRDIKPENILLSKTGQVKIADFGVAKIVAGELAEVPSPSAAPHENAQTEAGKIIGTPQYMAPEQLSHPLDVDHRADIYALGVVFYQMLTGELPVGKFGPPSSKVQIDVRLDEIVLRALQKQPELRYQQASVMKTQVETIAGTPLPPTPVSVERKPLHTEAGSSGLNPDASFTPRFSLTAIIGACAAFLVVIVGALGPSTTGPAYPDDRSMQLLVGVCQLFGLGFACGATLLGWIAVSQIRRSAGKLYGMGLAVFDGLLFPLLLLDLAIGHLVGLAIDLFGYLLPQLSLSKVAVTGSSARDVLFPFRENVTQLLSLIIIVIVDWLIVRWVWRMVNQPPTVTPQRATAARPPGGTSRFFVPVLRWFLVAFAVFVLTVLGGAYITFQVLPKIYTASAEIQVRPQSGISNGTVSSFDATAFQAEFEIMQSPAVLLPIIKDLNLDKIWAKRIHQSSSDTLSPPDALNYLNSILHLDLKRGTNIIAIAASSQVPREAADIANALADHYKTLRNVQDQRTQRGLDSLRQQIAQQQQVVDQTKAALEALGTALTQKGIAVGPDPSNTDTVDLATRKKALLAAQEDADARRVLLAKVVPLPDDEFIATLKALGRSQNEIDRLSDDIGTIKSEITNLLKDGFADNHPRVQALRAELAAKQQVVADLIAGVRRAMKVDTDMAQSRVVLLQKEVTPLTTKLSPEQEKALAPYHTALHELEQQQSLLDALNVRVKQVIADQQLLESPVRIISRAEPPAYPSKPNTRLNLVLSALAGILLGIVAASVMELTLWLRRSTSPRPASCPPTPSSASQNGKRLALTGAILQPASILLMIAAGFWQVHQFHTLGANGPINLDAFGAALSQGVVASITGTVLFFVSLIFLCVALAISRYRARWFFTFLTTYSWPLLLVFPFGTAAAIFFLIYCLSRRDEFSPPE